MAFVFPTRLIDSVNGMIGKVKIAVLRQVTLVGSKMTFFDQDGSEIDSVNITVDNVEGLRELVGSESKTYDTFDEYEWLEGQPQTFTLTYRRNFIYAITVNGQTLVESQFEENIPNKTFTILDELDPTDSIRVVYNTEEYVPKERYVDIGYVLEGYAITK